jgi:hypothetical protein
MRKFFSICKEYAAHEMCQWILKANGKVVPRRCVRPLQTAEIHSPSELKKGQVFEELIERRHGTSINPPKPKVQEHKFSEKVEFEYTEKVEFVSMMITLSI